MYGCVEGAQVETAIVLGIDLGSRDERQFIDATTLWNWKELLRCYVEVRHGKSV